jgi:hypothetical protein
LDDGSHLIVMQLPSGLLAMPPQQSLGVKRPHFR